MTLSYTSAAHDAIAFTPESGLNVDVNEPVYTEGEKHIRISHVYSVAPTTSAMTPLMTPADFSKPRTFVCDNWLEAMPCDISKFIMQIVNTPPTIKEVIDDILKDYVSPVFVASHELEFVVSDDDNLDDLEFFNVDDSDEDLQDHVQFMMYEYLNNIEEEDDGDDKLEKLYRHWFPTDQELYDALPSRCKKNEFDEEQMWGMIKSDRNYVVRQVYSNITMDEFNKRYKDVITLIGELHVEKQYLKR